MQGNRSRPARILALVILCLICLVLPAHADMGPKPDLTVTVVNAPEGACYVDLLHEASGQYLFPMDETGYDPQLIASLRTLEGDGWQLALLTGTGGIPIFGDLTPNASGQYVYSYHGLPDTFRLAVATSQGAQAVEQPYTRNRFHTVLVYDWSTNTLTERTPAALYYLIQLSSTLVPTLIIEGLVLLAFGFRQKRTWLIFLLTNVVTQLGLHLFCSNQIVSSAQGQFAYYLMLMTLPELIILVVETAVYLSCLREHSMGRRAGYGVCANLASFLIGFLPLHWLFSLFRSL